MIHTFRTTILMVLSVIVLMPVVVAAQQAKTETVTIQANFTTPDGNAIIGTIVLHRTCNPTQTNSSMTFNGMLNGKPVAHNAEVIERWLGNGREEIEVVSTTWRGTVLGKPVLRKTTLVQTSPGLVTIDGVPAAIDGTLQPPCSGRIAYTATNPGQGFKPIAELPNTAGRVLLFDPFVIMGVLLGTGSLLMFISQLLRNPRVK